MDELEDFSTIYFISGKLGKLYVYIPYIASLYNGGDDRRGGGSEGGTGRAQGDLA